MKVSGLTSRQAFRVKNGRNVYHADHVGSTLVTGRLLCKHSEDAITELELDPNDEVIIVQAREHLTHAGWRHIQT